LYVGGVITTTTYIRKKMMSGMEFLMSMGNVIVNDVGRFLNYEKNSYMYSV
jgi:hypothetical protein